MTDDGGGGATAPSFLILRLASTSRNFLLSPSLGFASFSGSLDQLHVAARVSEMCLNYQIDDFVLSNGFSENQSPVEILSKCEGSSIRVLVSGPRQIRHEVASICNKSCSTHDLHLSPSASASESYNTQNSG